MKICLLPFLSFVLALSSCDLTTNHRDKSDKTETTNDTLIISLQSPRGPYSIGTIIKSFTDKERKEVASPDSSQFRTLYTQIWFPTDDQGPQLPYLMNTINIQGFEKMEDSTWMSRFKKLKTNSIANAKISNREPKYPVVFFSGGFGFSKYYYTTFIEGLASNGYVVVGIDLPYVNPLVTESGEPINSQGSYWDSFPLTKGIDDYAKGKEKLEFTDTYYGLDYTFIYEQLKDLNAGAFFHNSMDLERMASLGHSAGASPTIALMQRESNPFDAFIVYDVTIHAHIASEKLSFPISIESKSPTQLFILEYAWLPSQEFIQTLNSELTIICYNSTNHSSLADIDFIKFAFTGDEEKMKIALKDINRITDATVNFLNLHIK